MIYGMTNPAVMQDFRPHQPHANLHISAGFEVICAVTPLDPVDMADQVLSSGLIPKAQLVYYNQTILQATQTVSDLPYPWHPQFSAAQKLYLPRFSGLSLCIASSRCVCVWWNADSMGSFVSTVLRIASKELGHCNQSNLV